MFKYLVLLFVIFYITWATYWTVSANTNYVTKKFTKINFDELANCGYCGYVGWANSPHPEHDKDLTRFLTKMITKLDYDVTMKLDGGIIKNPIVFSKDVDNKFEMYQMYMESVNFDKKFTIAVKSGDKYVFNHISQVQLYFESINNNKIVK